VKPGRVYLVGAGPGDPGLITVKGLDCLKRADVVLYDRLLGMELLDSARPEAERVYVGKNSERRSMDQDEINRLLIENAQAGHTVVRLKGGDPFVFGRGGEEGEALARHGVPFEVVPGVSSATAVPAYAGIPVTHRGCASSFTVVTGHEATGKDSSSIAWDRLATGADTLIFLMAVANLADIVDKLVQNGLTPSTHVALIHQGTTPTQKTLIGTLADIATMAEEERIRPPAVLVLGEVVRLRERLRWFDSQPLFGKRVLVTRPVHQASAMNGLLRERGARPVEMPVIGIKDATDVKRLDETIRSLGDYQWVVFTSANGVEAFGQRLKALGLDARRLAHTSIGAIGQATGGSLALLGLRADYVPEDHTSQGFLDGLDEREVKGLRFLLLRADIATPDLADGLAAMGADVSDVTAYRTVPTTDSISMGKEALLAGEIDVVTFTSSSTVRALVAALGPEWRAVNSAKVACIGPVTAATAVEADLRVDVEAGQHTVPGLVEAIEQYFQQEAESK